MIHTVDQLYVADLLLYKRVHIDRPAIIRSTILKVKTKLQIYRIQLNSTQIFSIFFFVRDLKKKYLG
jgi:hypothetical protein